MSTSDRTDPFSLIPVLRAHSEQGLLRTREVRTSPVGPVVETNGERLLAFTSNDYLGLANDPRVIDAFCAGAQQYGVGASASHLLGGHTVAHHALEEALAAWVGTERALLFSTGYMANLALLATLSGRHRVLYEDRRNHASLLDAAQLAGAKRIRYRDRDDLARRLNNRSDAPALIVTDGVFSMDGDIAALPDLLETGLNVVVDDAHALGVLGPQGRGTAAFFGLQSRPHLIHMGTLGKALGVFGAFVAGSDLVVETLIQKARPFIYTTALPPACAAAALASVQIAQQEDHRRLTLATRIAQFRLGVAALDLVLLPSSTPIQPIILGSSDRAMRWSQYLRRQGLGVMAVRPPTVPKNSARLRVTLSAQHSKHDIARLVSALAGALQEGL